MANSENSKIKILLIYDYFLRRVNSYDESTDISIPELIDYLKNVTGDEFERKSIYADINKINAYMEKMGFVAPGQKWIDRSTGRKYTRSELEYELSLDEARLIVDAISTTAFTNTKMCQKIKNMYPSYFRNGYKSLVKHDQKINRFTISLLNNIRECIDNKCVLAFSYGYKFVGDLKSKSTKITSPLALDWEDGNYYLIAVDNDVVAKGVEREKAIRRYRIDRIDSTPPKRLKDEKYMGFVDDKDKILEKYLSSSVSAYAGTNSRVITMAIKCDNEKELLKAYNAFVDEIDIKTIIEDRIDKGIVRFTFEADVVPPLFTILFKLYTFNGVTLDIGDDEVKVKFKEYLLKALG